MRIVSALTNPMCIFNETSARDVSYRKDNFALSPAPDTGLQSCPASDRVSELET